MNRLVFKHISTRINELVSSRNFFFFILAIVLIQGLWYCFSFKPFLFDEQRHLDFISFYAHTDNPIITTQTESQDSLGQVAREPSYAYYYLMSLIVRVIELISANSSAQIITLRMVNIAIFLFSLVLLRRIFQEVNIRPAVANVSILIYATIPAVGALVGAVTYDIGALPFIFGMVLITVKIAKSKKVSLPLIVMFYLIACVGSVIKYTSLPVAVACTAVILASLALQYKKKPKRIVVDLKKQLLSSSRTKIILTVIVGLFVTGLVIERPVQNLFSYKSLSPDCLKTLPKDTATERCVKNYVYKRNIEFLAEKPQGFRPVDPFAYTLSAWIPGMLQTTVQQYPNTGPLTIMRFIFYGFFIVGPIVLLIALKDILRKNKLLAIFMVVTIVYTSSVFYSNYQGYSELGQPVAISARYLLPVMPLAIVLIVAAAVSLLGRYRSAVGAIAVVCYCLLITQGGGIITHLVSVNKNDYWHEKSVISVNESVKAFLMKAVKD